MKCKYCGAKWRINYPFGKKSKPVIIYIKEHHEECSHKEGNKNVQIK